MGIPKKKSRTLEVDGWVMRFLVKETHIEDHPDQKELRVVVQEDIEKPGRVLKFKAPYGHPMTKDFIKEVVREAITKGWDPKSRGGAFIFEAASEYSEEDRQSVVES